MSDKPKMILYARVSTDDEKQEGSLGKQIDRMRSYCAAYEIDIVEEFQEEASAKNTNRPKLQAALEMLERNQATGIVVSDISRLSRDVGDMNRLVRHYFSDKYELISVAERIDTTGPMGRLQVNILTSVNQYFRESVAEKTKKALTHRKDSGKKYCKRVLGWKVDPSGDFMVPVQQEQECIGRIMDLHYRGHGPYQIAQILTDEGWKTTAQLDRTNSQAGWSHSVIIGVIKREKKRREEMTND